MLQVTETVANALRESLQQVDDMGELCVRVGVGENGLTL